MKLNWYKRAIAFKTSQSWRSVPHVSFIFNIDAAKVLKTPKGVTVNTAVLYIIARAIKQAPQVNAHIRYNRLFAIGEIKIREQINIAMPMLLANGEMRTVALIDAGSKTLPELQDYINDIRQITLNSPEIKTADVIKWARESKACTITVSNIGSLCKDLEGTLTMLQIIPPQVMAIGIGAITKNKLPICITFDHRALNFSDVLPFINALKNEFAVW